MSNEEILHHLGLQVDYPSRVGNEYRKGDLADVPPALREWAQDRLVELMRQGGSPAYIWKRA